MYLHHLETHRGLPVYDPNSNALVLWATEEFVRQCISQGKIKPVMAARKCVQRLIWTGPKTTIVPIPEEMAGYKPSEARPTRYSHNRDTEDNPVNVWTLIHLADSTQAIFLAVAMQCGGVLKAKRKKRRR